MTEQPPDAFSQEAIEAASARALELESAGSRTLRELARRLADEARATLPSPEGWLLAADGELCGLDVVLGERAASEGSALGAIHGFPDSLQAYFEARAGATTRTDAAGRYGDFLFLRWRQGRRGIDAVRHLLDHAGGLDRTEDEQREEGLGALLRAVDLSIRLNAERPEVIAYVDDEIRRLVNEDYTLAALELVQASRGLLTLETERAGALLAYLEGCASAQENELGHQQLHQCVETIARSLGDTARANNAKRAIATRLEELANRQTGLARLMRLNEADKLFGELNDGEALARVRTAREAAGREALGEVRSFEGVVTIPRDAIERDVERLTVVSGDLAQGFFMLASELGLWVEWVGVRPARIRADASRPFLASVQHVNLEGDGRTQPEPDRADDPEEFERARDIAHYNHHAQERAAQLMIMLPELRHRGIWSAPNLEAVLSIADDDLGRSCASGLARFEVGDDWSALHVLVPQLERALRLVGQRLQARVATRNRIGGIDWAAMNVMLEQPAIRTALGEGVATEIDALFLNAYGLNIRNNIAHGAYARDSNAHGAVLLTILTLLTLAYVGAALRLHQEAGLASAANNPEAPSD